MIFRLIANDHEYQFDLRTLHVPLLLLNVSLIIIIIMIISGQNPCSCLNLNNCCIVIWRIVHRRFIYYYYYYLFESNASSSCVLSCISTSFGHFPNLPTTLSHTNRLSKSSSSHSNWNSFLCRLRIQFKSARIDSPIQIL